MRRGLTADGGALGLPPLLLLLFLVLCRRRLLPPGLAAQGCCGGVRLAGVREEERQAHAAVLALALAHQDRSLQVAVFGRQLHMVGTSHRVGGMEPFADADPKCCSHLGFCHCARTLPGCSSGSGALSYNTCTPATPSTRTRCARPPSPRHAAATARTCTAAMRLVPALLSIRPVRSTVAQPMSSSLYLSLSLSSSSRVVAPCGTWGVPGVHAGQDGMTGGGWDSGNLQPVQVVGLMGQGIESPGARAQQGLHCIGARCHARVCYQ